MVEVGARQDAGHIPPASVPSSTALTFILSEGAYTNAKEGTLSMSSRVAPLI